MQSTLWGVPLNSCSLNGQGMPPCALRSLSVHQSATNDTADMARPCGAQALNIPTKINRGTVEIVSDVALITKGEKVGGSEATLLAKLGIKPFSYGLVVQQARSPARIYVGGSNL